MAKKLKDLYNSSCAKLLAERIEATYPKFASSKFVTEVSSGIRGKEFLARQDVFAQSLERHLPQKYSKALEILHQILGPELQQSSGMFTHGWWLWPVGRYIERNGLKDPKPSLHFIYELTKRFTGEFAIRPVLAQHPEQTLKTIERWSRDRNVHVRRLASEGIRIRLPWSKKLTVFLKYPESCIKILSNLREDTDRFVQKSVGNNINDLMKEDPTLAKRIVSGWQDSGDISRATEWIIRHGLRSERRRKG
jgi:3-methyladenine DNA glycosylase AlkC